MSTFARFVVAIVLGTSLLAPEGRVPVVTPPRLRRPSGPHTQCLARTGGRSRRRRPVGERRQLVPGHRSAAPQQPLRLHSGRWPAGHRRRTGSTARRPRRRRGRRTEGRQRRQAVPLRRRVDALDDPRARGAVSGPHSEGRAGWTCPARCTCGASARPTRQPSRPASAPSSPGPTAWARNHAFPDIPILGAKGQIVVDDEGVVDVSGGRVNLGDQYQITVHGLLRVHDDGFLAADHGTRLELLPAHRSHCGHRHAPLRGRR